MQRLLSKEPKIQGSFTFIDPPVKGIQIFTQQHKGVAAQGENVIRHKTESKVNKIE